VSNYNPEDPNRWGPNNNSPEQPSPYTAPAGNPPAATPQQPYGIQPAQQPQPYSPPQNPYAAPQNPYAVAPQQPSPYGQQLDPYAQGNPLQNGWSAPAVKSSILGKISMYLSLATVVPSLIALTALFLSIDPSSPSTSDTSPLLSLGALYLFFFGPIVGIGGLVTAIIAIAQKKGTKFGVIALSTLGAGLVFGFIILVVAGTLLGSAI